MEIVPLEDQLLVGEAYISPRDVAHVRAGMPSALVKLTAYDYAIWRWVRRLCRGLW